MIYFDVEPTGFTGKLHVEEEKNRRIEGSFMVFSIRNCENKTEYIYEE